ncbi:MAG: PilZ domain-containing protein [Desulfobacteraceae bacterium]|nr:PilZ domain-containing protein [Desulfobacteraceae bacterium]
MDDNHGESIEFHEISNDSQLNDIVRNSFRIPLIAKENYSVTIDNVSHPLMDVSETGIALELTREMNLMVGDTLSGCILFLGDETVEDLKGAVVHISPGMEQRRVCGIRWLEPGAIAVQTIESTVRGLRKELLYKNRASTEEGSGAIENDG